MGRETYNVCSQSAVGWGCGDFFPRSKCRKEPCDAAAATALAGVAPCEWGAACLLVRGYETLVGTHHQEALGVLGARDLRIHGTHYSPVSLPFPRPLLGA